MAYIHQGDGRLQNPVIMGKIIEDDVRNVHQPALSFASTDDHLQRTCAQ
jgi:hypothetical protein